ncbi:MAG: cytidine deaminase [Crocinitomicaceae bacterium]|nr:cytidine deaminase [Crocinitomicaceae bacterium]
MKEIKIEINLRETSHYSELPEAISNLCEEAIRFSQNAYAPYSKFQVSACALMSAGDIVRGTNVENASYPAGVCAERNVLSHAISNYPNQKLTHIAIYVNKDLDQVVPPCGICRQSLLEAETRQKHPIRILLIGYKGNVIEASSAKDLLPLSFSGEFLEENGDK